MEKATYKTDPYDSTNTAYFVPGPDLSKRKKVLIITPFNPEGIGGAETFTTQLIKEVSKHHDVDLLTCPMMKKAWDNPTFKDCFKMMMYLLPRAIWRLIRKRYETVHCLGLIATSVGVILKGMFGVKVISTTLALYNVEVMSVPRYNIASFMFRRADKVFVEDNKGEEEMAYLGVPAWRIQKFMHWVDLDRFKPEESQDETIRILFVGRPIKKKGIDIIRQVEKEFKKRNLKAVFNYVENVPYKDLPGHYSGSDIFVIPSMYSEGVARVVLEASASGLAIIASNRGSLRRLVDPFGVVTFPHPDSFRKALLRMYEDRKLLAYYKQTSRAHAMANFSARNAEGFLNEY